MARAVEGDLFSESGGLVWHAKALLRHGTIWADFRNRIDRFLTDWLGDICALPRRARQRHHSDWAKRRLVPA